MFKRYGVVAPLLPQTVYEFNRLVADLTNLRVYKGRCKIVAVYAGRLPVHSNTTGMPKSRMVTGENGLGFGMDSTCSRLA